MSSTDQPPPGPDPHGASPSGPSPFGGPSAEGPPATGHPESASPEGAEVVDTSSSSEVASEDLASAADGVVEDIDSLVDVTSQLEKERDEYLDRLRRLQADFENFKKRVTRQQVEAQERAGEDLAVKLLPVLDTIDLARQHGEGEAIAPLAASLLDVLSKAGLERIDPVGAAFDPNEHEAVSHEPSDDGGEPVVSGLMRAGYRWKGRLVRAAMVTVKG